MRRFRHTLLAWLSVAVSGKEDVAVRYFAIHD